MEFFQKVSRFFKNPIIRFGYLNALGVYRFLSDEDFLKKAFRIHLGKPLDLENPNTFNEKMQWLKLYYRKSEHTVMVDKYEVKNYIADKVGEEFVIPTLGVWDRFEDIDFNLLPNEFVMKCTHDSGGLVICRDKQNLDFSAARKKINKCLKKNYYSKWREWPYKEVRPRIIVEEFMKDKRSSIDQIQKHNLSVYKIFNFAGTPKIIQMVMDDKQPTETIDYFDVFWNHLEFKQNFPNRNAQIEKPTMLDEMLRMASTLSQGFPFLRTDFYLINDKIYFSEFTFFSDAGLAAFAPAEWDSVLGSWIKLPEKM